MDKRIASIIRAIGKIQPGCSSVLGDIIAPVLFNSNQAAMVFNHDTKQVSILSKGEIHKRDKLEFELYGLLMSLMAEVKYMSENSLVIIPSPIVSCVSVFYENKTAVLNTQNPGIIDLGDGITLFLSNDEGFSTRIKDREELRGRYYSSEAYDLLMPIICARVYPGSGLTEYIQNGFQSPELRYAKNAYRISIIAIIVSLFLCVISPIISNLIGKSTLNNNQFRELLEAIQSLKNQQ